MPDKSAPQPDAEAMLLYPVPGVSLGTAASGSKYKDRDDLTVIQIEQGASTAAVFTRNRFCAAPVIVAKNHLQQASPRYLLINAGNANAGTGKQGIASAETLCDTLAGIVHCKRDEVLPFSTGVIGEQLPVDALKNSLPAAVEAMHNDAWQQAAAAILTTDLVSKVASTCIELDGETVTITGTCKGSGMIHPNMATMLAFVATDVCMAPEIVSQALRQAVDQSFNCITVDGDTSTNDACVLVATQKAANREITRLNDASSIFIDALNEVFLSLAQQIIRDGEGASKFVKVEVSGAANDRDARMVADTVALSPLVKTALFASDPNWGRILAAVGRAPVDSLDINSVDISLGDVAVIRGGNPASDYREQQGKAVFAQTDISININLGTGNGSATVWTTDFSYDYVKINAEYRT